MMIDFLIVSMQHMLKSIACMCDYVRCSEKFVSQLGAAVDGVVVNIL